MGFHAGGQAGPALAWAARRAAAWLAACACLAAPSAWAQATLTVAAFPAMDKIIAAALPAWKARHPGVDVQLISRQMPDHHTAMTTALSTASQLPDVMALEIGYVRRFAQSGALQDLSAPPFNAGQYQARIVPYAWQQSHNAKGALSVMPADIGPGTLLYRADILAKAQVTEAELTRSWDSYVAAGVKIKAATHSFLLAHARDMKEILIRTSVQPGEGLYFDAQNKPLVTTPRFERAFELARQVRAHKLDAKVGAWSNDWSEGFRRGTIATQMSGAWLAGHLANWLAPATRGQWRAAQLPEGAWAAYGGAFYALPKAANPANQALAWDLVQALTLDRAQQLAAFKAQDAFPALVDAHNDAFFDEPIAFLGGQPARQVWREATRHINAVAVHKLDNFAEEVVNTELDKVLNDGKPIALALADAQRLLARRANR